MHGDAGGTLSDEDLLQLWHLDVAPATLGGAGEALSQVLAEFDPVDMDLPAEALPQAGWRVIGRNPTPSGSGGRVELAAPHAKDPGGWAMIALIHQDGRWRASAHPGPVTPTTGRALRRRGLRLRWPEEPIVAKAGSVPELEITLTNVSGQRWSAEHGPALSQIEDDGYVLAWLLDGQDHALPADRWWAHGGTIPLPPLEAGATVTLPVHFATESVKDLPAGQYGLTATLVSLNLRSNQGTLLLA